MAKCDYEHCNNEATHLDWMQNLTCEECMVMEIEEYGNDPEEYEEI
ncbi:conserved hypothetical protein [Vibrio phage 424E50-1]|nr:conserved hypothetical protein [Vibrio phage 424E50-1]